MTKKQLPVVLVAEDEDDGSYEREVHPNLRKFWEDLPKTPHEPLGRHPVFTLEGKNLDKASFKHTKGQSQKAGVPQTGAMGGSLMSDFSRAIPIERRHAKELEKLAVRAVAKLMHVDESELEAKLTDQVYINETAPLDPEEMKQLPKRLLDEANKRITSNAFAQGGSVHAYLTSHFVEEIEAGIKKIDPNLFDLYKRLAPGMHHFFYWLFDFGQMNLAGAAVGSVAMEQDEKGEIKAKAKAKSFIVLVQELVKGVLEKRYLESLMESDLTDEEIKTIYQYADKIEDEPRLIQIGPELWRRFLKVVNASSVKKKPVEVYKHLMKLRPKELHDFVELVVNKPQEASGSLELMLADRWKEEE
jgi:hypothetical protein